MEIPHFSREAGFIPSQPPGGRGISSRVPHPHHVIPERSEESLFFSWKQLVNHK
jgi:hypothetical protein